MKKLVFVVCLFLLSDSALAGAFSPAPGGRASGTQIGGDQGHGALLSTDLWGWFDQHDKRLRLEWGLEVVIPRFTSEDRFGRKQVSRDIFHPMPWTTVAWRVSDKLALGFNLDNPFRLGSAYADNRDQWGFDTKSLVGLTTASFLVDYKVHEDWHLSFGPVVGVPQVIYNAAFDLNRRPLPIFTESKAMGLGWGATAGLYWQANEKLKLGLQYVSPIEPETWGHTKIHFGPFRIKDRIKLEDLVFPQTLALAGAYQIDERWQVVADAYWWNYSKTPNALELNFRQLLINKKLNTEFKDVLGVHLGANCRLNEDWSLRFGVGWLGQGVPDKRLDTLTQDVAGWDFAVGVNWRNIYLAWTHGWGKSENDALWLGKRKYEISIDTLSVGANLNWKSKPQKRERR